MITKNLKAPTHHIWQVIDLPNQEEKVRWIRVGAAWANKDGKGLSCKFDSYPIVGRIVVREVVEEAEPQNAE